MSDVYIDMTEVRALAASLDIASAQVATKAAVAVKDAAIATRDQARQDAPVLTGALRDSLRMTGRALTRRVRANVPYGIYVEFGTTTQAPQPFLYPAVNKAEEQLVIDLAELAAEDMI